MDIYEIWDKALKHTEIIRSRLQTLMTFQETRVPYILLSESTINLGDTVVRKGEVLVERPSLILPPNTPQFEGFELDGSFPGSEDKFFNYLLVRGISLPSLCYNHKTQSLDLFEGKLSSAIKHYNELLQQKENVSTGLLAGPEECWQFSVLIFICSQIAKNADTDLKRILDEYKKRK
ncbi:MAG: hypothetical protein A2Z88_09955 [Omnitrophica WOR_2 bacterium GWA2_47_8]|nr:MAG: hypothetical protein A2Z88_09955 [Omnitrophica WOR_2 bacterium GWA2_47_8]